MTIKKVHIIIFILLFLAQFSFGQRISAERVKAKYLFEFPMYLQFPNDEDIDVIYIGLLKPSSKLVSELKEISKKGYENGVKVEVVVFNRIEDIKPVHELYVDSTFNYQMNRVLQKISGKSVALVTENYKEKKHIMLNIVDSHGNIGFEVSFENLSLAKINKYPQFSQLGGKEITTRALFEESEKNLQSERQTVQAQKEEIKRQQDEIKKQTDKIKLQKDEILNQQNQIEEQKSNLEEIRKRTMALANEVKAKSDTLNRKGEEIRIQKRKLREQIEEMNKQAKILNDQNAEIENRQAKIDNQKQEITNLSVTIAVQKNLILIFIVFLSIITILSFFLFRAYRIKRKDNIMLASQKQEIEQQAEELEIINKELEKLSLVASETSSAVAILDNQGNFEWINAGFTKMYGYTYQLLINELDENIIKASKHPDIKNIISKCFTEKHTVIYESSVITRNGEKKWAQTTLTPIFDNDRNVKKLVLIDSDISKIKEAEAEIKFQNRMITQQAKELAITNKELEKLSLVASKTENSVIIAKTNGDLEWVNDAFERMLGITFQEFKEQYGSNLFTATLNPNLREQLEEAVAKKESIIYTAKTVTKKGRLIWIQTTMTPIFNDFGRLTKYIAIDADVTKIKLAEEEIAKQKEKIIESIQYASRIQNAVLPPLELFEKMVPEHFILFMPKDIVSGDFYWAASIGDKSIVVAADCTGHGVPGAFMSMLGITFLSSIVVSSNPETVEAHIILNRLRENIKQSLRQTGKEGEAKDGMDIALCIFDFKKMQVQYAGAHNSLLLVRNKEVIEYVADDMPIGIFYKEKSSFTNNIIDLQKDDRIYIASDGYCDQFGGEKGRKFMIKRFKDILLDIHERPMQEQHDVFRKAHIDWKGDYRQIDDILVIGMKI